MEKLQPKHGIPYYIGMGTITAAIGLVVYVLYLAFYPVNILQLEGGQLPVHNKTVQSGDNLTYTLEYCKNKDITATVHKAYVDTVVLRLPTSISNTPVGCHTLQIEDITIPHTLETGKYYVDILLEYKVNALRTETYHLRTEDFTIIK